MERGGELDGRIRVLLVEDDTSDASLFAAQLGQAETEFEVRHVQRLADALETLRWADCVLVDLGLPDADGFEALDALAAVPAHPALIVLTGRTGRSLGVDAIARGATDYVSKDAASPDLLDTAIRQAVERHRIQRRLETNEERLQQLNLRLQTSEARLQALLRHSRDTIVIVDAEGVITYASPAIVELTGHQPGEAVGQAITEFLVPDEQLLGRTRFDALLRGEPNPGVVTYHLQTKDGRIRSVEVQAVPLFDDPTVDGVVLDVHDVTEIVEYVGALRSSEQRYRALLDAAPTGIALVDRDGTFTFVNHRLADILGLEAAELSGLAPADVVAPVHRSSFERQFSRLATGETPGQLELELHRLDGTIRWVNVTASVFTDPDGSFAGALVVVVDITDHRRARQQLELQAQMLRSVGEAIVVTEPDGTIVLWNVAAEELYGWSSGEVIGRNIVDVTPSTASAEQAQELMEALTRGDAWSGEFEVRRRDGTTFPAFVSDSPILDENGKLTGIIGVSFDISDRVEAERTARQRATQHAAIAALGEFALGPHTVAEVFQQAAEAAASALGADIADVVLFDDEDQVEFAAAVGLPDDVVGLRIPRSQTRFGIALDAPTIVEDLRTETRFEVPRFIRDSGAISGAITYLRVKGNEVGGMGVFHRSRQSFTREDLDVLQSISNVVAHVLEREEADRELSRRSVTDDLTGGPNRALFVDRLHHALTTRERRPGRVAVLFADLDRFKDVNDVYGHGAGDALLRGVFDVLSETVPPGDTVARFGGDEFAVLCEDVADIAEAVALADRIVTRLAETPIRMTERDMTVSASIGVVIADGGSRPRPDDLLRDADVAMYRAKSAGGGRVEVFDRSLRDDLVRRLTLTNELSSAITNQHLVVHYQPEESLRDGTLWAEALVRWDHPIRGLLAPAHFIDLAEETGLIVPLGAWVLEQAVRQMARWARMPPGTAPTSVAVNVSARQLVEDDLVGRVSDLLADTGLAAGSLWVELTETALLRDPERSLATLEALSDLGVGLAIDDFGTGYSSLSYARELPMDALKIDRSFIDGLGVDPRDEGIVAVIIDMARTFDVLTIAEGVETAQQYEILDRMGCDFVQGFLLTKAAPAGEIEAWARQRQSAAAPSASGT